MDNTMREVANILMGKYDSHEKKEINPTDLLYDVLKTAKFEISSDGDGAYNIIDKEDWSIFAEGVQTPSEVMQAISDCVSRAMTPAEKQSIELADLKEIADRFQPKDIEI
ncbi:MAG: hypothetical protein J5723_09710 [Ruminococcus sp.]|nr:hypothetical protein [Ruminococcus sp.]